MGEKLSILAGMPGQSDGSTSRRSNAEKRAAVEEVLSSSDGKTLSLREIAERTGVHR
jgi:transposase-like protein